MPYDLTIPGWMTEFELKILEQWAQEIPEHQSMVEIGSMMGRSSVCWASSCKPTVSVYCIDSWGNYLINPEQPYRTSYDIEHNTPSATDLNSVRTFIKNTILYSNIIPVEVDSPDMFPSKVKNLNPFLVFLDASHTNPSDWNYLDFWRKKIVTGGILCGHDYTDQYPDVQENVHHLESLLNTKAKFFSGSTLWRFDV